MSDELAAAKERIRALEAEVLLHQHRESCTCIMKRKNPSPGGHHRMSCMNYVGPLEHRMSFTNINGTFGGADFICVCGGWFRQGGIAGHGDGTENAEVVCPRVDKDWRGPRP